MEDILIEILSEFKKAEYKIHVLHTSMQGDAFLSYHPFLGDVYKFIQEQDDEIMESIEQLGYNVPTNLSEIIKEEKWEDEDSIIELQSQTPNVQEQLQLVENTLMTLKNILQQWILTAGMENDYVIQNNLIEYQKQIRIFERKNRRVMGKR